MNEPQNDWPNTPFEVFLTAEQLKIVQSQLPKGFSLQFSNKPYRREKTPKLKKKLVLEDPAPPFLYSHSTNSSALQYKPAKKVKTVVHPNENSGSYTTNTNDSSYKRSSLREKKFTNFDHKYADFENTQLSSGFNANAGNLNVSKNLSESMRKCLKILSNLKKHQFVFPFLKPVDPIALQVPDYFDIVKEPMDLGTVERNLRNGVYATPSQFSSDVRKIWNNSFLYNAKGSDIYHMTISMSNYFEKLFSEVEINTGSSETYIELHKKVEKLTKEIKELHTKTPSSNPKLHKNVSQINEKPMTLQEKRNLGQNIRNLPPQYLRGVWEIVNDGILNQHKEELEFDIDTLPVKKCRDLERYVNAKLALIRKNENKDVKVKGKYSDKKTSGGKKMDSKIETEKKFYNEENNFPVNNNLNNLMASPNRNRNKQEIYENQIKENLQASGVPTGMMLENLHHNLQNFEVLNAVAAFPVNKNIDVLEYPTDEKKAQTTTNFTTYQNEAMKSSDSSFITDSEEDDSLSEK